MKTSDIILENRPGELLLIRPEGKMKDISIKAIKDYEYIAYEQRRLLNTPLIRFYACLIINNRAFMRFLPPVFSQGKEDIPDSACKHCVRY